MFGKLKEKLKNWATKVSEKVETKEKPQEEEQIEFPEEVQKEIKEKDKERKKRAEKEPLSEEPDMDSFEDTTTVLKESTQVPFTSGDSTQIEPSKTPKKSFVEKVKSKIQKVKISEKEFDIYADELEMLLLENNVAIEVAEKMIQDLKNKIVGKELLKKEIEEEIKDSFRDIIREILIDPFRVEEKIKIKQHQTPEEPYVILFCGINGSGKTTSVAKIAELLKQQGISSVMAAADTFRAAAIDQLKKHGEKIGIKVVAQEYGADPAAVGFDAIQYAKKNKINCVLIDTAGRMHTSKNLMQEIEKIAKVCNPDIKVFVGESITGNDAIEQVKSFNWAIKLDGIILTKSDIDEKGGTALSVGYITKKPILYLGTGQEYKEIERFDKEEFIKRLGL